MPLPALLSLSPHLLHGRVSQTIVLSTTLLLSVARGPHLSSMLTLISPNSGIRVIDYPFITSSPKKFEHHVV